MLANDNRQIFAYFIPGDFCDLNVFMLNAMDHNTATLTDCTVVDIPVEPSWSLPTTIPELLAPHVGDVGRRGHFAEWLVNLGNAPSEAHRASYLRII